jgi:hypothetical protein
MNFEVILPRVMPSVKGCMEALALDHIVMAARTFCSRTMLWQYDSTILSASGVGRYTLQIEDEQELVRLLLAEVNGVPYSIPTGAQGRRLARQGAGNYCTLVGTQDFVLSPAPDFDGTKIVTDIAVKPSLKATQWPDDFEEYVADLARGAVGSLTGMPKKDWTDQGVSQAAMADFNSRINTVALQVSRGFGTSHRTVRAQMR